MTAVVSQRIDSNDALANCIKVKKLYDWVSVSEAGERRVAIPEACLEAIESANAQGLEVTASCSADISMVDCHVLSIRRSLSNSVNSSGAVVKLLQIVPVTVNVLIDGTVEPSCTFTTQLQLREEAFLCLPEPLDEQNIICRVRDITCTASVCIFNNNVFLHIDIDVCKEVRVEADNIIEVIAKHCQPRAPISAPKVQCPIQFDFPPQCDFLTPVPPVECCNGVTDEVCGSFNVTCDGASQTIWSAGAGLPIINGSVTISLDGPCTSINVVVNGSEVFVVSVDNAQTITLPLITSIALQCNGNSPCIGSYCLSLHYALDAT